MVEEHEIPQPNLKTPRFNFDTKLMMTETQEVPQASMRQPDFNADRTFMVNVCGEVAARTPMQPLTTVTEVDEKNGTNLVLSQNIHIASSQNGMMPVTKNLDQDGMVRKN